MYPDSAKELCSSCPSLISMHALYYNIFIHTTDKYKKYPGKVMQFHTLKL